jgi:hypothetical protein
MAQSALGARLTERHVAALRIPLEIVAELLGLPPGARIIGYRPDEFGRCLIMGVEHADLPEQLPGCMPPEVSLTYSQVEGKLRGAWSIDPERTWPIETPLTLMKSSA